MKSRNVFSALITACCLSLFCFGFESIASAQSNCWTSRPRLFGCCRVLPRCQWRCVPCETSDTTECLDDTCDFHYDEALHEYVIDRKCTGLNCKCPLPMPEEDFVLESQNEPCVSDGLVDESEMLFQVQLLPEEDDSESSSEFVTDPNPVTFKVRHKPNATRRRDKSKQRFSYKHTPDGERIWQAAFFYKPNRNPVPNRCKTMGTPSGENRAMRVTVQDRAADGVLNPCTFYVKRNGTTVQQHGKWKIVIRMGDSIIDDEEPDEVVDSE